MTTALQLDDLKLSRLAGPELVALLLDAALLAELHTHAGYQRVAEFYSPDQPRNPAGMSGGGRWASVQGGGLAHEAARQKIREMLLSSRGTYTDAHVKDVAEHLSRLTVAQIHSLKKEFGVRGSGPNKRALIEKLAERFHGARKKASADDEAAKNAAKEKVKELLRGKQLTHGSLAAEAGHRGVSPADAAHPFNRALAELQQEGQIQSHGRSSWASPEFEQYSLARTGDPYGLHGAARQPMPSAARVTTPAKAAEPAKASGELPPDVRPKAPLSLKVEHSTGYSGVRSAKSYVAKITGLHSKYGLDREFVNGSATDKNEFFKVRRKGKGSWTEEHPVGHGIHEIQDHTGRSHVIVLPSLGSPGKYATARTSEGEIKQAFGLIKNSGHGVGDLLEEHHQLRRQAFARGGIDAAKTVKLTDAAKSLSSKHARFSRDDYPATAARLRPDFAALTAGVLDSTAAYAESRNRFLRRAGIAV